MSEKPHRPPSKAEHVQMHDRHPASGERSATAATPDEPLTLDPATRAQVRGAIVLCLRVLMNPMEAFLFAGEPETAAHLSRSFLTLAAIVEGKITQDEVTNYEVILATEAWKSMGFDSEEEFVAWIGPFAPTISEEEAEKADRKLEARYEREAAGETLSKGVPYIK